MDSRNGKDEKSTQYDCVVDITSLIGLDFTKRKGWALRFRPELRSSLESFLASEPVNRKLSPDQLSALSSQLFINDKDRKRVCVVGLFDRGKTHVMNQLAGVQLNSSVLVHTEGISIKLPVNTATDQIILLDTQGTNSPLEKKEVMEFINHIESEDKKMLPGMMESGQELGDDEDMIPDDILLSASLPSQAGDSQGEDDVILIPGFNQMEKSHIVVSDTDLEDESMKLKKEQEEAERIKALSIKGRNKAIISKQSTEVVVQDIVFELSDVVITVVNEVTFEDQLSCDYLARKLQDARARNPSRWAELVVVHNFKTITDTPSLDQMVEKYVKNCFDGIEIKREVTVLVGGIAEKKNHFSI